MSKNEEYSTRPQPQASVKILFSSSFQEWNFLLISKNFEPGLGSCMACPFIPVLSLQEVTGLMLFVELNYTFVSCRAGICITKYVPLELL